MCVCVRGGGNSQNIQLNLIQFNIEHISLPVVIVLDVSTSRTFWPTVTIGRSVDTATNVPAKLNYELQNKMLHSYKKSGIYSTGNENIHNI